MIHRIASRHSAVISQFFYTALKSFCMNKLLTVEFSYGAGTYYALVRLKQAHDWNEFHISVMDGQLENHVGKDIHLIQKNGRFVEVNDQTQESGAIIRSIMQAITERLKDSPLPNEDTRSQQA